MHIIKLFKEHEICPGIPSCKFLVLNLIIFKGAKRVCKTSEVTSRRTSNILQKTDLELTKIGREGKGTELDIG